MSSKDFKKDISSRTKDIKQFSQLITHTHTHTHTHTLTHTNTHIHTHTHTNTHIHTHTHIHTYTHTHTYTRTHIYIHTHDIFFNLLFYFILFGGGGREELQFLFNYSVKNGVPQSSSPQHSSQCQRTLVPQLFKNGCWVKK